MKMDVKFFENLLPESSTHLLDLHTAASIGCEERVVDILENLDNKLRINHRNSSGWTALMYAACCANLRIISLLLEEGAYTDIKNIEGHTAMILAAKSGSTDAVNMLIRRGASINDKDSIGWSALSYAAAFGHRSVVQLLMESGALSDHIDRKAGLPATALPPYNPQVMVNDLLHSNLGPMISKSKEDLKCENVKTRQLPAEKVYAGIRYLPASFKNPEQTELSGLAKLLSELNLSKYYPVFENHGIDLNMFWLLSEDDIKEIGIQLLGPRKKLCTVIAEWYKNNFTKGYSDDRIYSYKLILEHRKLQQQKDEIESMLSRETELRKIAETNLNEGIKTLKNFSDTVQRTMAYTVVLEEKLKQSQVNLKKLLCATPEASWPKVRSDIALPLIEGMDRLLDDIHRQTFLALQQTSFRK